MPEYYSTLVNLILRGSILFKSRRLLFESITTKSSASTSTYHFLIVTAISPGLPPRSRPKWNQTPHIESKHLSLCGHQLPRCVLSCYAILFYVNDSEDHIFASINSRLQNMKLDMLVS